MSGSGRETLSPVWKWSGDPPAGPEVVGRPSQKSGCDRDTISKVRQSSGDPPLGPEGVKNPS